MSKTKDKAQTADEPGRVIEYRPLDELSPDPRNPKSHALETIDASVGRFGFVEPIVVDGRTGYIISGHGRTKTLQAMAQRGEGVPEGIVLGEDGRWLAPVSVGWSSRTDTEAAAALIALNRTTELGGWVDDALLDLLDELGESEDGLSGVGYDEDDLDNLRESLASIESEREEEEGEGSTGRERERSVGERSSVVDVLWEEPTHDPKHGDIWQVGPHILIVARLQDEHEVWAPYLTGRTFCPYPEPYLTLSELADEQPLLLVQPIRYLAGHTLDKYASVFPGEVKLITHQETETPEDDEGLDAVAAPEDEQQQDDEQADGSDEH